MVSYWERRRQDHQRRELAKRVGVLPSQLSQSRAQAEARVAQPNADERAQVRLREEFPADPLFGQSGTGRVRSYTPEEQAANRRALEEFVFGPERPSVVNVGRPASRPERLARDWFLSEQEFRTAGERAREGELLPAVGWAGLGLAGVVPVAGDAAQALARGGRAAEAAADVARAGNVPVGRWASNPNAESLPLDFVEKFAEFDRGARPTTSNIDELAESISQRGFDDPLILEVDPAGRAVLIEGNHRLAAARALGLDEVPVRVVTSSPGRLGERGAEVTVREGLGSGKLLRPSEAISEQAADVARAADTPRLTVSERLPSEPQIGKSIEQDATPGLVEGEGLIRGIDQAFTVRGEPSPWAAGERIAPTAPGLELGRAYEYKGQNISNIRQRNERSWRQAIGIIKELEPEALALDASYYSPLNPRIRELFDEAVELAEAEWSQKPRENIVWDPDLSANPFFDVPDEEALRFFSDALLSRARAQVRSHNLLLQFRMQERIAALDGADEIRRLNRLAQMRREIVPEILSDSYPMIQTDSFLFDSKISRQGFLNQYITNTSNGDLDFSARVIGESALLGISPHLGPSKRPVYGFLGRIPRRGSIDANPNWLTVGNRMGPAESPERMRNHLRIMTNPLHSEIEQYGDISVVFNRDALNRTTFTIGDSLEDAQMGRIVASPASNVDGDAVIRSTTRQAGATLGGARYFELQYINPSLDDIVAIHMRDDAPYRTVLNALRRAGLSDVDIIVGAR